MKRRSWGVTLFGILFILSGAVGVLNSARKLSVVSQKIQTVQTEQQSDLRRGQRHLGLVLMASVVFLIQGIGVLRLRRWARWLTLIYAAIQALLFIKMLTVLMPMAKDYLVPQWWVGSLVNIGQAGLTLWYFLRPSVKAQFASQGR